MMKAVLTVRAGSEDNLQLVKNRARPPICDHEVLIQVKACALSALDAKVLRGDLTKFTPKFPLVGGYEISGVVRECGSRVTNVKAGDEVVVLCALDSEFGGLAEFTVQDSVSVLKKPELLTHEEAAASLLSGFQAYIAFHYATRLKSDDVVLVCSGPFVADTMHIQLAGSLGARVIIAATSTEELNMYGDCGNHVVRVIDMNTENIVEGVMKETGGMGVDCVLDMQDYSMCRITSATSTQSTPETGDDDKKENITVRAQSKRTFRSDYIAIGTKTRIEIRPRVSKTDIIRCLGVHSTWLSPDPSLQLDPPDCRQLFFRGAKLAFLFPQCWVLAPRMQGRYMHVMKDMLDKVSAGVLKPLVCDESFPMEKARHAFRHLASNSVGKVVVRMDPQP